MASKHWEMASKHWETVGEMLGAKDDKVPSNVYEIDRDVDLGELHRGLPEAQSLRWRELEPPSSYSGRVRDPARAVFVSPYLSYGDYDNSCHVERSNYDVFYERHGEKRGIFTVSGGYGSNAIAILLAVTDEEVIEDLASLENYPVLDEDHLPHKEMEMQQEAFDSWARQDFVRELEKRLGVEIDDPDGKPVEDLFWERLHEVGEARSARYAEVEAGGNVHFPMEQMVAIGHADLHRAKVKFST